MNIFYSLILSLLLVSYSAKAGVNCEKNKVYCQIVKINKNIDKEYAMKLSNIIYNISKKYNLRPHIYTAILAQESMFKLNAKNCTTGIQDSKKSIVVDKNLIKTVCADFGISQINYRTIQSFDFDIDRLLTDLEYSIEAGAIVLSDMKKRHHHKESYYWSRYNTSNKEKREKYKKLVERYIH